MQILTHTPHYLSLQVDLRTCVYKSFARNADPKAQLAFGINHTVFGHSKGIRKDDTGFHNFGSYTELRPCLCIRDGGLVSTIKPNNPYWDIDTHQYIWQAGPSVIFQREFTTNFLIEEKFSVSRDFLTKKGNFTVVGNTPTGKLICSFGFDVSLKDMCFEMCKSKCFNAMLVNTAHPYVRFKDTENSIDISIGKVGYGLQVFV